LEYAINEENFLRVWKENNSYKGEIKKFPFQKKIVIIKGIIEDNLLNAINRLNEKDKLGLELAEIFGWDIDFYTDLRKGDEFILIFEKNYLEGKFFKYGNILAAKFKNKGKEFIAIRYVYPDTNEADYFAPDGKSIRKEFLKSPLKYGRITSRFNYRRFHPIFKKYTPHYGVDYSAPIGTPVQATADGVITFIGRKKGSGKIIKIRHKNTYESFYLHLSRFRKGLKKGIKVKQGDIIGYVGSTGLSIGPHLDYRVKFRGKYINPLRWKFKTAKPVRKEYLNDFLKKSFKYIRLLEKLSTENKQINRMLERNGLSS
ncbi:peptidoglycan DD-metalloendopeptidase family protein, partial [Candidatus Aminicenantes bacterium AH-873-B07]|nr:peptidoglycan DD-metalloendopeptidase family protein [Candidatus Aminicenantes bacterium AH-873-B07]